MKKTIHFLLIIIFLVGCTSKVESTEDFEGEFYHGFPDTGNIIPYSNSKKETVKILKEVEDEIIFCFIDDRIDIKEDVAATFKEYIEVLEVEGYKLAQEDNIYSENKLVSHSITLETKNVENTIIIIADRDEFKRLNSNIKNVSKIENENVLVKITLK